MNVKFRSMPKPILSESSLTSGRSISSKSSSRVAHPKQLLHQSNISKTENMIYIDDTYHNSALISIGTTVKKHPSPNLKHTTQKMIDIFTPNLGSKIYLIVSE